MYYCGNCPTLVGTNQPMNRVVVEKRPQSYENPIRTRDGRIKGTKYSEGWEIVKEIAACPKCFTALTGKEAVVVEVPKKVFQPRFRKEFKKRDDRRPNNNNRFQKKMTKEQRELEEIRRREKRAGDQDKTTRRAPHVQVINQIKVVTK